MIRYDGKEPEPKDGFDRGDWIVTVVLLLALTPCLIVLWKWAVLW